MVAAKTTDVTPNAALLCRLPPLTLRSILPTVERKQPFPVCPCTMARREVVTEVLLPLPTRSSTCLLIPEDSLMALLKDSTCRQACPVAR